MDGKIARVHCRDLEAGEYRRALVSTTDSSLIRRHRSLRNQLCLTRTAVAFLLLVCMSLSAVIYVQSRAASSKNNDNNEGQTAKLQTGTDQNTIVDQTDILNFTTVTMSRPPHCEHKPDSKPEQETEGTIEWDKPQKRSQNFDLTEDKKALIFHQSGWYQITLQITYEQRRHHKPQQLNHYLMKNSDSYPDNDMTVLSVYQVLPKNNSILSVHSGTMVQIQAGDRLKVISFSMQYLHCESRHAGTASFLMAQLIHPMAI